MKKNVFCSMTFLICFFFAGNANAVPIERNDFNPTAINYGFDDLNTGTQTATWGDLTITNGIVLSFTDQLPTGMTNPNTYYYEPGENELLLDFSSPVSAMGMSIMSKCSDVGTRDKITLNIFNDLGTLLESKTIAVATLPIYTMGDPELNQEYYYGFIGLDIGSNGVAYAKMNGSKFHIDEVIYQKISENPVPEPSTMLLVGLGMIGITVLKRIRYQ